jgi:acetyltransferase-like isoleucine patch superfamily enzyme
VTIERGAWIGARAVILPGLRIGAGAVVAAGAVVTQDVAPDVMVGGVPARELRAL